MVPVWRSRIVAAVCVSMSVLAAAGTSAQTPELRWGGDAEGGAPFVEADPNDPARVVGFEVDIAQLLAEGLGSPADQAAHDTLSERELQVFLRLARGETVGHIADGMSLSVKTVSTYRSRVLEKLSLNTNSELTYYALKNGLIE